MTCEKWGHVGWCVLQKKSHCNTEWVSSRKRVIAAARKAYLSRNELLQEGVTCGKWVTVYWVGSWGLQEMSYSKLKSVSYEKWPTAEKVHQGKWDIAGRYLCLVGNKNCSTWCLAGNKLLRKVWGKRIIVSCISYFRKVCLAWVIAGKVCLEWFIAGRCVLNELL